MLVSDSFSCWESMREFRIATRLFLIVVRRMSNFTRNVGLKLKVCRWVCIFKDFFLIFLIEVFR